MLLLSAPQQPGRMRERLVTGADAALIALSWFHAHFSEAAITAAPGAAEVGTLFTNNRVLHWFHHQILGVNTCANVAFDAQLKSHGHILAVQTF